MSNFVKEIIIVLLVVGGLVLTFMISQCIIEETKKPESIDDLVQRCAYTYEKIMDSCCGPNDTLCMDREIHKVCIDKSDIEYHSCMSKFENNNSGEVIENGN